MAKRKPDEPLTEEDRRRIGEAREVLQSYGLYVDVADMSDVAYERRVCRMKALDTMAAMASQLHAKVQWLDLAKAVEAYIWTGDVPDGDV